MTESVSGKIFVAIATIPLIREGFVWSTNLSKFLDPHLVLTYYLIHCFYFILEYNEVLRRVCFSFYQYLVCVKLNVCTFQTAAF